MKLEITQSNLLFQDVQDWRQRRRTKYNELARTISNELQKFEGKNLLALDYVNSGGVNLHLFYFSQNTRELILSHFLDMVRICISENLYFPLTLN